MTSHLPVTYPLHAFRPIPRRRVPATWLRCGARKHASRSLGLDRHRSEHQGGVRPQDTPRFRRGAVESDTLYATHPVVHRVANVGGSLFRLIAVTNAR